MHSNIRLLFFITLIVSSVSAQGQQVLTLRQAMETGVKNYGTVKARTAYAAASDATAAQARREQLPNLNLIAQQDYGTVNGQSGPLYGFGGGMLASSGSALPTQNWNAAFGGLYLANINWDIFSFGRAHARTQTATLAADRDHKDLDQEIFNHKIKIAAAYLNLLAAHQLTLSYEKNLDRADTFRVAIVAKAKNHLVAGVDSSQANAEYSNARIALTRAREKEQELNAQLVQLMGIEATQLYLDSSFVSRIPSFGQPEDLSASHPSLLWYKSRIDVSDKQTRYLKSFYYPTFSIVGVVQTRGSGFGYGYLADQTNYSRDYWTGINPTRSNYLLGLGMTWNLAQAFRMTQAVKAQRLTTEGLRYEYEMASQQLRTQNALADSKIRFALDNYREVGIQVKAASDAYLQKSVLYRNGLTNLVDLTQAMYTLVRAETDRDIAYSNVWQALLLKAASTGDMNLFESQL